MPYTVRSLPRAEFDAQQIYDWIRDRSPDGAVQWWQAFLDACERLRHQPTGFSLAPEADLSGRDIRHTLFKTRRGNVYRALFTVADDEVLILRVRGPGQPPLQPDELPEL
jgi:plasmid stabilization system protein ParE